MSFLYPRTIKVTRPNDSAPAVGLRPYSGEVRTDESIIATNLPASIQQRRKSASAHGELPSDAPKSDWAIFIPKRSAALGLITERDIVTDDLGKRYQVAAAYWDSLGYQLLVMLLQI